MLTRIANRSHLFLLFVLLSFFNPVTLFLFRTSLTFIVVVPFTLMIWFAARWEEITTLEERSNRREVFLGVGIYVANLARNAVNLNARPMFGLFDMLVGFIGVCLVFYGLKGLKHFILPIAYLSILIIGYQIEFMVGEVIFLQNFLAQLMASTLNLLGIASSLIGNSVTVYAKDGGAFSLTIDKPCTGIKGMLAYGSLAILMILDVKTTKKRKALCTLIGLFGTFLVNILRLLTIFLACYFFGIDTAMAVHTYLGYGLFILWIFLFWTISFKYILRPQMTE